MLRALFPLGILCGMSEKDDILADGIITRQIQLLRFTASTRGKVLEILRRMEEELTEKLFYSGRKLTEIGRDDLARLLRRLGDDMPVAKPDNES